MFSHAWLGLFDAVGHSVVHSFYLLQLLQVTLCLLHSVLEALGNLLSLMPWFLSRTHCQVRAAFLLHLRDSLVQLDVLRADTAFDLRHTLARALAILAPICANWCEPGSLYQIDALLLFLVCVFFIQVFHYIQPHLVQIFALVEPFAVWNVFGY